MTPRQAMLELATILREGAVETFELLTILRGLKVSCETFSMQTSKLVLIQNLALFSNRFEALKATATEKKIFPLMKLCAHLDMTAFLKDYKERMEPIDSAKLSPANEAFARQRESQEMAGRVQQTLPALANFGQEIEKMDLAFLERIIYAQINGMDMGPFLARIEGCGEDMIPIQMLLRARLCELPLDNEVL